MRYLTLWRNKWLTSSAQSVAEMASMLEAAAGDLRTMAAAGITLDPDSDMSGDFAHLVTDNPELAAKFGMEEDVDEEDENWSEDDCVIDDDDAGDVLEPPKRAYGTGAGNDLDWAE